MCFLIQIFLKLLNLNHRMKMKNSYYPNMIYRKVNFSLRPENNKAVHLHQLQVGKSFSRWGYIATYRGWHQEASCPGTETPCCEETGSLPAADCYWALDAAGVSEHKHTRGIIQLNFRVQASITHFQNGNVQNIKVQTQKCIFPLIMTSFGLVRKTFTSLNLPTFVFVTGKIFIVVMIILWLLHLTPLSYRLLCCPLVTDDSIST